LRHASDAAPAYRAPGIGNGSAAAPSPAKGCNKWPIRREGVSNHPRGPDEDGGRSGQAGLLAGGDQGRLAAGQRQILVT
jgi:hypothetical protein